MSQVIPASPFKMSTTEKLQNATGLAIYTLGAVALLIGGLLLQASSTPSMTAIALIALFGSAIALNQGYHLTSLDPLPILSRFAFRREYC